MFIQICVLDRSRAFIPSFFFIFIFLIVFFYHWKQLAYKIVFFRCVSRSERNSSWKKLWSDIEMKNVCLEQVSAKKREKMKRKKSDFKTYTLFVKALSLLHSLFFQQNAWKTSIAKCSEVARDEKKKLWKKTNSVFVFAARLQCFDIKMLLIILKLYVCSVVLTWNCRLSFVNVIVSK